MVCRRLGVERIATFEEVQDARNYLYEVCAVLCCNAPYNNHEQVVHVQPPKVMFWKDGSPLLLF